MRNNSIIEKIAGDTLKATWVSSGAIPSMILSTLRDQNDLLVSSLTPVSSGGGHFYANHQLPNSAGWYVNEWWAFILTNTYRARQFVKCSIPETD